MTAAAETRSSMRTVILLSASQAIIGSQQALNVAVAALVGVVLAPDPRLATVPVTAMVLGLAFSAGPAVLLIHRFGRKRAFVAGAAISIAAGLVAATGIWLANFYIFCLALALGGAAAAFGQQYRFAAADSAPPERKGAAISWVLAGGVFAGFIGPALSRFGRTWIPGADFAGSFLAMSGLALFGIAVLLLTNLKRVEVAEHHGQARPLSEIVRAPEVFVPVISGMASYGLMTFVMVAAPLAMVVICGHSKDAASTAIQWHVVAMFAPSFLTGTLISRLGARAVTAIGLTLILVCALINLNGTSVWHFDFALVMLGVGWNFGFIGSTTLLSQGYRPQDSARAQAFNEQLVFGTMAIASICSGILLQTVGWQSINILALPLATFALAMLAWGDWHARKPQSA